MLVAAIVDLFKYKLVNSIIVLACWPHIDRVKFMHLLFKYGITATFTCSSETFEVIPQFQGVLYFNGPNDVLLERVKPEHYSHCYKWMVVGDYIPSALHHVRYDVDAVMLKLPSNTPSIIGNEFQNLNYSTSPNQTLYIEDIMVHPHDGASIHPWAYWTKYSGLKVTHDREKILRRLNFRRSPIRIASPISNYSPETYEGSYEDYMEDITMPNAGVRCGYGAAVLITEALNATKAIQVTATWLEITNKSEIHTSMYMLLLSAQTEMGAGTLRPTYVRMSILDYIMPIWLFSVGFTYLAERDSSSNMYIQPFTTSVWWTCLVIGIILALAQRFTARKAEEKEGAYMSVLATWLQQDAGAVPTGTAGRWTFSVMSICSMLVHAYYTSAIVSALMSAGRGGPNTLRELGDSNYDIASEFQDFMGSQFFNRTTPWSDFEYLKKKKMTSNLYRNIDYAMKHMKRGTLAYHAEYHQLYSYYNRFNDEELCKIKKIDTIPEKMSWVTGPHRGQYTNVMRSAAMWVLETGLARRLILRTSVQPPPCRAAMLAERVVLSDIVPLIGVSILAAFVSIFLLTLEIIHAKWKRRNAELSINEFVSKDDVDEISAITM